MQMGSVSFKNSREKTGHEEGGKISKVQIKSITFKKIEINEGTKREKEVLIKLITVRNLSKGEGRKRKRKSICSAGRVF